MSNKRPPVFFTIAALQHEPLKAVSDYMPKIQDDLRKEGYSGQFVTVDLSGVDQDGSPGSERMHQVFTPNRMSGFSFNEIGVFSYHTTEYVDRATLFAEFRKGLNILHKHVGLRRAQRVGVRMLDLLRPSDREGRQFADYVKPSMLGFRALEETTQWTTGTGAVEQAFSDDEAEIKARFQYLPNSFGMPMELFPTVQYHQFPPGVADKSDVPHGFLDIDSGTKQSQTSAERVFDIEEVMKELERHKDRISSLFRAVVTDVALSDWGLKQ